MPSTIAIITGASTGIGAALARHAIGQGATVATASRRPAPGSSHLGVDLADPAGFVAFEQWMAELLDRHPDGDVALFHCAATLTPVGFAGEEDGDSYRAAVLLNSGAPQVIGDAFLRAVRERPGTRVLVQIGSGAARTAYPGWSHYGAGKAALDQWVRVVGEEQRRRPNPVRVLSVSPGVVATGMQAEIRDASPDVFPAVERFVGLHARGELRDPDQVAGELWGVAFRTDLATGSVLDLRTLG